MLHEERNNNMATFKVKVKGDWDQLDNYLKLNSDKRALRKKIVPLSDQLIMKLNNVDTNNSNIDGLWSYKLHIKKTIEIIIENTGDDAYNVIISNANGYIENNFWKYGEKGIDDLLKEYIADIKNIIN